MNDELRTTNDERKAEGGIVIGRDILDMMADAGKRHESLRKGHLRVSVDIEGGDIPKRCHFRAGTRFSLEHYGVYADGQNFARYAHDLKSTDDIAAALREGFVASLEHTWRRESRAKKAADWVANFLPYAAMLVIGVGVGGWLFGEKTPDNLPKPDPERAAQHLASEAVEVAHEPAGEAAAPLLDRVLPGGRDAPDGKDGGPVVESAGPSPYEVLLVEVPRDGIVLAGKVKGRVVLAEGGDRTENPVVPFVHDGNSTTNAAEGGAE